MKKAARLAGPVAVVVASVVGIATAPIASADAADDQYLQTLRTRGLGWPNDQAMINIGHAVCSDFDGGDTAAATIGDVKKSLGISSGGANIIVGAAVAAYCPENRSKL
jgi:hypothetical protein